MTETAKRPFELRTDGVLAGDCRVVDAENVHLAVFSGPYAEAHARMFAAAPELEDGLQFYADEKNWTDNRAPGDKTTAISCGRLVVRDTSGLGFRS